MIGNFPVTLLIPGLLFIAAGFYNRNRAKGLDRETSFGKIVAESSIRSGNLSIILGGVLLAIAIPLAVVIRSML